MVIRKTLPEDIDDIMTLIGITRENFRADGIPQWQGEYPSRELIADDVARGESYVCDIDGRVCGFCAVVGGIEPDYVKIYEGRWRNERQYISLHRVAVDPKYKGCGIAAAMVSNAVRIARKTGILDIRCDTHRQNANMRRMLEKNGFEYCGIIYLCEDGAERVAYHKIISQSCEALQIKERSEYK